MTSKIEPSKPQKKQKMTYAEIATVAANVVKWDREQAKAYVSKPLAYVECLLDAMADAEDVDLGSISSELRRLVPWLSREDSDKFVDNYMDRSPQMPRCGCCRH